MSRCFVLRSLCFYSMLRLSSTVLTVPILGSSPSLTIALPTSVVSSGFCQLYATVYDGPVLEPYDRPRTSFPIPMKIALPYRIHSLRLLSACLLSWGCRRKHPNTPIENLPVPLPGLEGPMYLAEVVRSLDSNLLLSWLQDTYEFTIPLFILQLR